MARRCLGRLDLPRPGVGGLAPRLDVLLLLRARAPSVYALVPARPIGVVLLLPRCRLRVENERLPFRDEQGRRTRSLWALDVRKDR